MKQYYLLGRLLWCTLFLPNLCLTAQIDIQVKVNLQGPYTSGSMTNSLGTSNLIPLQEPYTPLGYNHKYYGGNESVASSVLAVTGADAIVDWVVVEIRDETDNTKILATRSALLQRDGDVVATDGVSPVDFSEVLSGNYYVAVRHRNHLGVMTSSPILLESNIQPCGTESPTGAELAAVLADNTVIKSSVININTITQVPIHFNIFRTDDKTWTGGNDRRVIDVARDTDIENALNWVNAHFASAGIEFVNCGGVTYIDNSVLYYYTQCPDSTATGSPISSFTDLRAFQDFSNVINTYVINGIHLNCPTDPIFFDFAGIASFPWLTDTYVQIVQTALLNSGNKYVTLAHELGHSFGLLHTHDIEAGHELVLRSFDITKPIPTPNCDTTGDLLCETPADFIGCPWPTTIVPNCSQNVVTCLNADANGDAYRPSNKNFMSYWFCREEFVAEQNERLYWHVNNHPARNSLSFSACSGTTADAVEFEGTANGMPNVWLEYQLANYSRGATTQSDGSFEMLMTEASYKPFAIKNGTGIDGEYVYADWLGGVTTFDVIRIQQHITGVLPFDDGYKRIAADVNESGTVTTFDQVLTQALVLGNDQSFAAYDAPFRFIPEYIPQDHTADFNNLGSDNPLDNAMFPYPDYLESNWVTPFDPSGTKNGLDAIKLGDVNGSYVPSFTGTGNPTSRVGQNSITISTNKDCYAVGEAIELVIKGTATTPVIAYQLGLFIDPNYLDIQTIHKGDFKQFDVARFGCSDLSSGAFKSLWVAEDLQDVDFSQGEESWFTVRAIVQQPLCDFTSAIRMDDSVLSNTFYTTDGTEYAMSLELHVSETSASTKPYTITSSIDKISFDFDLSQASDVTLRLADLHSGRLFYEGSFVAGRASYDFDDISALNGTAIRYTITINETVYTGQIAN